MVHRLLSYFPLLLQGCGVSNFNVQAVLFTQKTAVTYSECGVPPTLCARGCCTKLAAQHEHQKCRDSTFIILGDFNHCNLKKYISKLYKSVDFTTRGKNSLDHCDINIRNVDTAEPKPHFGKFDHLTILLKPTYTVKTINTWTDSALANLESCLELTDLNIFREATNNIHEYAETVGAYIS